MLNCYAKNHAKDYALKIINHVKKEMIPQSEEENKSYKEQDVCHIFKKKFCFDENENDENEKDENENDKNENNENDNDKNEKHQKVKDHYHYARKFRGAAHNFSREI